MGVKIKIFRCLQLLGEVGNTLQIEEMPLQFEEKKIVEFLLSFEGFPHGRHGVAIGGTEANVVHTHESERVYHVHF